MVITSLFFLSVMFLLIIEWWVHVTEIPDEIKMIVFKRGISNGLNGMTPIGGHNCPISTDGDSDEWKYAQKKDKKNITSEMMNKIIPIRRPRYTFFVCIPWKVDSRVTSRHQSIAHMRVQGIDSVVSTLILLNHAAIEIKLFIILIEMIRGHGLGVTRWNGWLFFIF